jgi:hypothetical protein
MVFKELYARNPAVSRAREHAGKEVRNWSGEKDYKNSLINKQK